MWNNKIKIIKWKMKIFEKWIPFQQFININWWTNSNFVNLICKSQMYWEISQKINLQQHHFINIIQNSHYQQQHQLQSQNSCWSCCDKKCKYETRKTFDQSQNNENLLYLLSQIISLSSFSKWFKFEIIWFFSRQKIWIWRLKIKIKNKHQ